jgi:RimJ/RimL family protein N-acetyltransferase
MMTTAEVLLQPFERKHLAQTREWVNDPVLMHALGREAHVTEAEHDCWFENVVNANHTAFFALIAPERQQHIGNIWLWDICRRHAKAEIRILIGDPAFQGQGKGNQAIQAVTQYAFANFHLHKLYAYVLAFNLRALRAFEKAEFQLEGTLKHDRWSQGKYVDVFALGRVNA